MPCASYQCTSALRVSRVESDRGFALQFPPATSPKCPNQARTLANPNATSDDLHVLDRTDDLKVHLGTVARGTDKTRAG